MTVLLKIGDFTVISHLKFLEAVYSEVLFKDSIRQFHAKKVIFGVREPYKIRKKVKNSSINEFSKDAAFIADQYESVKEQISALLSKCSDTLEHGTLEQVNEVIKELNVGKFETCQGGNSASNNLVATIGNNLFFIPSKCSFFCCDVKKLASSLSGRLYDVIVMDPPWWNKYIRRKRKMKDSDCYDMMYNDELANLPIRDLLEEDGLVVVWCTNSKTHIAAVTDEIFPRWGLSVVSQWFWLKVTNVGEVVTPFSPDGGKQPFERIIFGARPAIRTLHLPEKNKILVSVPSAIHSHKPPLCEVLEPFLPKESSCLEVFARYLLPNWTSIGNEVLKLQNLSLFDEIVR